MTRPIPDFEHSRLTITLAAYDRQVTVTLPVDSDMHELLDAFRGAAMALTYQPVSIDQAILSAAADIDDGAGFDE